MFFYAFFRLIYRRGLSGKDKVENVERIRVSRMQKLKNIFKNTLFPIFGLISLIWFLVRVLPKPSRATYPCMRAAAPLASTFVIYLLGIVSSAVIYKKAKLLWSDTRYSVSLVFLFMAIISAALTFFYSSRNSYADFTTSNHTANMPIGEAQGIFPGMVVWYHNPEATNEDCIPNQHGHGWFLNENNNQDVIDQMLSHSLNSISGASSDSGAWKAIFAYFNDIHGKGLTGYQSGENIFIKTNATSSWGGNFNPFDLSIVENYNYGISETSPQLVLSVLRQLVYQAEIPQNQIYVGDPMKHIYKHCYEIWHGEFPEVHYMDHDGYAGREKFAKSDSSQIFYSDRGDILRTGTWEDASVGDPVYSDYLYTIFEQADYVINMPTLKGHKHAGITMFAKNHFGSHTRDDAKHLHGGLVAPEAGNPRRQGYELYRVQVDLMGHELLSGKNLIYILDALWPSDYEIDAPDKWQMAPFNDDWMSSIFVSLDPVAIESVGFDFLRTEYTADKPTASYPQMEGVDDYLHQAADSANWPDGIMYDPEQDGSMLASLGVHEHWNNADDMQYARNLGEDYGINLVKLGPLTDIASDISKVAYNFRLEQNYPNPFNNTTRINYTIEKPAMVFCAVYNINGQLVRTILDQHQTAGSYSVTWDGTSNVGEPVASGIYIYLLQADGQSLSRKMIMIK
jgi:hypothetical protein